MHISLAHGLLLQSVNEFCNFVEYWLDLSSFERIETGKQPQSEVNLVESKTSNYPTDRITFSTHYDCLQVSVKQLVVAYREMTSHHHYHETFDLHWTDETVEKPEVKLSELSLTQKSNLYCQYHIMEGSCDQSFFLLFHYSHSLLLFL